MYHSSCLRPRLLRREKFTSSVGPSIQRGRKHTFLWSALDSPVPHMLEDWPFLIDATVGGRASSIKLWVDVSCGEEDAIDRLSGNLQKTTSFFRKQTADADKIVRASYDVSRILARWLKPFSDGDFIKQCHVAVVDSVCPEQRSVFETVSLPSRTVRRCIEEMSQLACAPDDVEPDTCVSVVASMREGFASRFAGIKPLAADFKLFTAPLTFPWTTPLPLCRWSWWSYSAMMN